MPVTETVDITPSQAAVRTPARSVLMADPTHFDVEYVINAHMEGQIGCVNRVIARLQWEALAQVFRDLGLQISVIPAVEGLPDMVFSANQSFPLCDGSRGVVLSQMARKERRDEVAHFAAHYADSGFECLALPPRHVLEGMGDVLWHPGRRFAYAGWGFRTRRASLDAFAALIDAPVLALHLVDERFYHLDTCLAPLDEQCALYVREAFDEEGIAAILTCFPEAVAIPVDEAAYSFACNGVSVLGHFIVQAGCLVANEVARARGLVVVEVETGEFLKSGGSVGCLHIRLGETW